MFEWGLSASGAIFSFKKMGATEGYIIVIVVKSRPPSPLTGWRTAAAAFISVGAATRCGWTLWS